MNGVSYQQEQNLRNNICNVVHAIALEEAGFKQESLFYYHSIMNDVNHDVVASIGFGLRISFSKCYSAYTLTELLKLLPMGIDLKRRKINGSKLEYYCEGYIYISI